MRIYYTIFITLCIFALPLHAASSCYISDKIVPRACSLLGLPVDTAATDADIPYQAIPDPSAGILQRLTAVCDAYPNHAESLERLTHREQLLFNDYMTASNPRRALLRRASYARLNNWPESYLHALDTLIQLAK